MNRETRLGARESNGQELFVLHKPGREPAALGSLGADGLVTPHGKGRARCAAAGPGRKVAYMTHWLFLPHSEEKALRWIDFTAKNFARGSSVELALQLKCGGGWSV